MPPQLERPVARQPSGALSVRHFAAWSPAGATNLQLGRCSPGAVPDDVRISLWGTFPPDRRTRFVAGYNGYCRHFPLLVHSLATSPDPGA